MDTAPTVLDIEDAAMFFKVLGDPTRLRIVYTLLNEELYVNELSDELDLSVSAVSHQLALLRQAKLVTSRRDGKQIYYRLDDDHVSTILDLARVHLTEN